MIVFGGTGPWYRGQVVPHGQSNYLGPEGSSVVDGVFRDTCVDGVVVDVNLLMGSVCEQTCLEVYMVMACLLGYTC